MAEYKGHAPTQRRLEDARKRGRVVRSRILTQNAAALAVCLCAGWLLQSGWVSPTILLNYCFNDVRTEGFGCVRSFLESALSFLLISLGAGALVGLLFEFFQVGLRFAWALLSPQLERCSPFAGFGTVWTGMLRVWRTILMVALLGTGLFLVLNSSFRSAFELFGSDVRVLLDWCRSELIVLSAIAGVMLLLLGAVEYVLNRRSFLREMSMTTDEVRRDYREEEGDPLLKSARRALHEALALREVERRVKRARVIIVERNSLS